MTTVAPDPTIASIVEELRTRNRFVLSSHARPDGDSIGSQLALAAALHYLGKTVRIVNRDPIPPYLQSLSRIATVEVAETITGDYDAAVLLECGSLDRTEVTGLDHYFVINVDHHAGNSMYGALNWFDESAAACGEMVFDLVTALGVPLSTKIATAIYVAILTDTGAFHHGNITARTFEICRHIAESGVSAAEVAARVYQTSSVGKLWLTGAILNAMKLEGNGRVAVLHVDEKLLYETGCAPDDMEGLINLPLAASHIQAVILLKPFTDTIRVSLRSKAAVDIRTVALAYGGGGHRNAAGFTASGSLEDVRPRIVADVLAAIDASPPDDRT